MLNVIIGKMGTGKSVLLSYYALIAQRKGKKVYANYKLEFDYEPLRVKDMLGEGEQNAFIAIDEADRYVTKMRAGSKAVQETENFLMQSRKKQIDLFLILKSWDLVFSDIKMLVEDYTTFYYPKPMNKKGYPASPWDIQYRNIDYLYVRKKSPYGEDFFRFNASRYFNIYNTDEIIPDIFK